MLEQGPSAAAAARLQRRLRRWGPELTGTLVFLVDGDRVLLIEKKTGHGAGKINAPGGKLEPGETPVVCARREVREEVGVEVARARLAAELKFVDIHWPQWFGYAFVATEFSGVPRESAEARPFWCDLAALPFERMWEDDRVWLPYVLPTPDGRQLAADQTLTGEFLFTQGKLLAYRCLAGGAPCA